MTLSLDTAYRSFGGEVEASSTPTICRLPDSRRHQLLATARGKVEPHAARMGELLQGRHRQHGLSSARQLHGSAVASVVALQAQSQAAAQGRELSTLAPVRALRART